MSISLISPESLARSLSLRDLTDPAAGHHAMQLVVAAVLNALTSAWGCQAQLHRAHPVVSIHDNYERLRYPPEATTRDARYTRYVSETRVLRTHTTAMIAPLLDDLATQPYANDVLLAPIGLVYRRDVIDRIHVGEPHQMDLWRVRRGQLGVDALEQMIVVVAGAIAPGARHRTSLRTHPYTLQGRQIDIEQDGNWIEIGECGLAHPDVLRDAGLDPREWSGLAMGVGLDRAVMLCKRLDDIRLLRSEDPRVAEQMLDLSRYRPVSHMPAVRRDLSIAVEPGTDAETLGHVVREALGDRATWVEDLAILAETPASNLPPQAADRIGIQPGQLNLLVRLVLRHPTQTLTDHAANLLRDEIYAVVHHGQGHQWAARTRSRATDGLPSDRPACRA